MSGEVQAILKEMKPHGRFEIEARCFQHGNTTVYAHSIHVADTSLRLQKLLGLKVDRRAMIRGALLHDYFLYDWHVKDPGHRLHGFIHPKRALQNAKQDFTLSKKEENIILRHMFPLTPVPPSCTEAWLVCLADKYCALTETFSSLFAGLPKLC